MLAKRNGLDVLARIVKIGAAAVPIPGVAVAGEALAQVVEAVRDAQNQRRYQRSERLVESLQKRLEHLEREAEPGEHVDLFMEYMAKAIDDEDNAKTDLYAAFMTWVLERRPNTLFARLLGEAVRNLTSVELRAIVHIAKNGGKPILMGDIDESVFWNRVTNSGLSQGGTIKFEGNLTELGRTLVAIWPEGAFAR